jgi:tetratricopeptide (TPR) repeat protein
MLLVRHSGIRSPFKAYSALALALLLACSCTASLAVPADEEGKIWQDLQREGTRALDSNEYWIAEPTLKKALAQAEHFGFGDMRLAKSLGELGRLYTVRGQFAEAEAYLEEELAVKVNVLGKEDGQIIPPMGSLIRFYLLHGTASKAEPLTEDVLDFVEGKLKEPLSSNSGKLTMKKGQPLQGWAGSAAPVMRDPLIEWAITCDDLGGIYLSRGNLDVADRFFKAALDMKATVLGKEHLSLANSYESLGEVCLARNEQGEAESYFRDALMCTERILPPENPAVYGRLDKLAKCLIKAGKYQQAEELYLRAQNFWKADASKYANAARAKYALGCLYLDQKNYAAAQPVLKEALDLAVQYYGPSSAQIVPYLQRYAYGLYYLGQKPETEELKARASIITGGVQ